jgi:hypothetical protein
MDNLFEHFGNVNTCEAKKKTLVTKEKKHCLTVSAMDGHPTQYESFFVLDI